MELFFFFILALFFGSFIGTVAGMLPGIGPATMIAILIPYIVNFPPHISLIFVASVYYATQYGGSTTAILFKIPGESSSVVTCLDGHKLNLKGRAKSALAIAAIGSFVAGIISCLLVYFFSPILAKFSIMFTPIELFSLSLFGLYLATTTFSENKLLSLYATSLGLLISFIGINVVTGENRFTHGIYYLYSGLDFIVVVAGLIGGSELIENIFLKKNQYKKIKIKDKAIFFNNKEIIRTAGAIGRGTVIGSLLGLIPGGGGTLASFFSYGIEKKITKQLGQGKLEGVAAPESANNAAVQTGFIPLLALGIPENIVMALILGLMQYQGLLYGPMLFNNSNNLIGFLVLSMFLGNLMLIIFNFPLIKFFLKIYSIPQKLLFLSAGLILSIGIYLVNQNYIDIIVFLFFSILGLILKYIKVPILPIVMGFVLGPMIEDRFIKSLIINNGNIWHFFNNYVTMTITSIIIIFYIINYFTKKSYGK